MATAIINNLYPPIMDTYMPAFDRNEYCRVYFSLSSFNDYINMRMIVKRVIYLIVVFYKKIKNLDKSRSYT